MTTILPLQDLLSQPSKVKRLTAAGYSVRITEHGRPLWLINADQGPEKKDAGRIAASWDKALEELEREITPAGPVLSAAQLLLDQRRETLR